MFMVASYLNQNQFYFQLAIWRQFYQIPLDIGVLDDHSVEYAIQSFLFHVYNFHRRSLYIFYYHISTVNDEAMVPLNAFAICNFIVLIK